MQALLFIPAGTDHVHLLVYSLVVPPNNAQNTPPASPSNTNGAVPVGAANAGLNPLGISAAGANSVSGATLAFSVVAAVVLAASF